MATDYSGVCDTCRVQWHIGQRFTVGPSFGYGSNDEIGRLHAATYLFEHAEHGTGARVVQTDDTPEEYADLDEGRDTAPDGIP